MWFLSVAAAFAVPPDKQVALLEVGTAQLDRFTLSPDGRFLAGRDARGGAEGAWILDLETWAVATLDETLGDCRVAGVAVRPIDGGTDTTTDDYAELWIGCSDGTLRLKEFADGVIYDIQQSEDDPADFSVTISNGLASVWYDASTDMVYALSFADDNRLLHRYDPFTGDVDGGGYPVPLNVGFGYGSLVEGSIVTPATGGGSTQLILAHGDAFVSTINLAAGTLAFGTAQGSGIGVVDITPSIQGVYAVDNRNVGTPGIYEFIPSSSLWNPLAIDVGDIDPQAVVANLVPGDEWMVVFGSQIRVWEMTGVAFQSTTPYWESPELGNFVHDGLAYESYVYGGGEGGGLRIVTARPWIEPTTVSVSPAAVADGDDLTITFTVDEDADYTIHLNGDRFAPGVQIASGQATAGVAQTFTVPVRAADDWIEGTNAVYIVATGADGLTGHAVGSVTADNPPTRPNVPAGALSFEDELLVLDFPGIPDADLASYRIYVSDEPFTADDDFGEESGPTGRINGVSYPLEVTAAPGARVEQWIRRLDNDVAYWVAVRAVDAGGKESEMSRVLTETPRPGQSAAELTGERGGGPCSTGSGAPSFALALGALVALRRRAGRGALAAALALAPGAAQAQDERPEPFWRQRDLGSQYGTFEVRYESLRLEDPGINETYDDTAFGGINLQFGPQWRGIVELDFGIGLIQKKGVTEAASLDGGPPVDTIESLLFTAVPLNMDIGLRLKLLDEQILVPHVKGGVDYYPWKETQRLGSLNPLFGIPDVETAATGTGTSADPTAPAASSAKTKTTGWNLGAHYAIGGALLLDVFAPARASLLEAQTGVNDTYLLVEWRRQVIDNREVPWKSGGEQGFTFTGSSVNVGLKLDF